MSSTPDDPSIPRIIPAQLNFLAIYNPELGTTDATRHEQIVFYYSRDARERRRAAASKKKQPHDPSAADEPDADADNDDDGAGDGEANERMRRVGLAQGMVNFARGFSQGEPVEAVESEKRRVVLRELEKGWWILASIDLTRLPKARPSLSSTATDEPTTEHSAREVSPAHLLLSQLHRAHHTFLLHHAPTLSDLYVRHPRPRFLALLHGFWSRFARRWDVLLHGNPAADALDGARIAAAGELGVGVGEEERGSAERAVLEGLAHGTEGLVDLGVWRFGEEATREELKEAATAGAAQGSAPWLGAGASPAAADGLVFAGVGALTRRALRSLSAFAHDVYVYGDEAYGVRDNPSAGRRRKRRRRNPPPAEAQEPESGEEGQQDGPERRQQQEQADSDVSTTRDTTPLPTPADEAQHEEEREEYADSKPPPPRPLASQSGSTTIAPKIPPPIVSAAEPSAKQATTPAGRSGAEAEEGKGKAKPDDSKAATYALADPDVWMKVLTLGYGSAWRFGRAPDEEPTKEPGDSGAGAGSGAGQAGEEEKAEAGNEAGKGRGRRALPSEDEGFFLVGLGGDLSKEDALPDDDEDEEEWNSRLTIRTVVLEVKGDDEVPPNADEKPHERRRSSTSPKSDETLRSGKDGVEEGEGTGREDKFSTAFKRLRLLVYVRRPFIYLFLFEPTTSSLSMPSFFRSLHQHLTRLHKPLLASTSPSKAAARLHAAITPAQQGSSRNASPSRAPMPIFNLVYDRVNLTVHTSIPNIPMPGTFAAEGFAQGDAAGWTRVEALNVHAHILATLADTRRRPEERDRTAKTSRGWWIVWMRVPGDSGKREVVLVRRSGEGGSGGGGGARRNASGIGRLGMDSGFGRLMSFGGDGSSAAGDASPSRLNEGIGVDARRYVEGLLSLNR